MKKYWVVICFFIVCGCARVEVVPLSVGWEGLQQKFTPTPLEQVKIFRSTKPNLDDYQEMGVITVKGEGPNIEEIYQLLRKKASDSGAHLVVDFKLKTKLENRTMTHTTTTPQGAVSTYNTNVQVLTYTAAGTLLRRKKNEKD